MLYRAIINIGDALLDAKIQWKKVIDDYIVDVPENITLTQLVELVEECKRLTKMSRDKKI